MGERKYSLRSPTSRCGFYLQCRAVHVDHFDRRAKRKVRPADQPLPIAHASFATPVDDRLDQYVALTDQLCATAIEPLVAPYPNANLQDSNDSSQTGGTTATVAIVDAYDTPFVESDMNVYRSNFNLPPCTTATLFFNAASCAYCA